ncbi:hypothetical protein MBLNU459_g3646t1 [Dothideomycetes sp. NU459]
MWHFADLDDAQKHQRRHLLDVYGAIAQFSALAPLLVLQAYLLSCYVRNRWIRASNDDELDIPSSPYLKKQRQNTFNAVIERVRVTWRRTAWWTGDRVEFLGFVLVKGEVVTATIWTAWLLVLSISQTGDDYLHLTKRFAIVGASQLPLHYLLALKSPYSPLQLMTGYSWETLNAAHQLLGRIITLLFYLHTAFYLNFYVQMNLLAKRVKDRDVILGLTGILSFTLVGTTALAWIRKRNYRIFYTVHVVLATILLPVLYFHVSHIRIYVLETLAVYILQLLLRGFNDRTVRGSVALVSGTTDLLEIKIPLSLATTYGKGNAQKKSLLSWQPGQHVYISTRRNLFSRPLLSKNPFTISSLPAKDGNLTLVARVMDGNTAALARAAKELSQSSSMPLTIEGPYGLTTHSVALLGYKKVLLIAGGVGATFILPLYRTLLQDLSPSAGSRRRDAVSFVWAVRTEAEANWALVDESEMAGIRERMQLFVTRGSSMAKFAVGGEDDAEAELGVDRDAQETGRAIDVHDEDGVELEQLLPTSSASHTGERDEKVGNRTWNTQYGRPDLKAVVDETFVTTSERDRVAIFVCGPRHMTRNVRKEVKKWVGKRDIWFWAEEFGL